MWWILRRARLSGASFFSNNNNNNNNNNNASKPGAIMEASTSHCQDSAGVQPEEKINLDELQIDDPQFPMKMLKAIDQAFESLREVALEEVAYDRLITNLELVSALSPGYIANMSWLSSFLHGDSHQRNVGPEPAAESLDPNNDSGSS